METTDYHRRAVHDGTEPFHKEMEQLHHHVVVARSGWCVPHNACHGLGNIC